MEVFIRNENGKKCYYFCYKFCEVWNKFVELVNFEEDGDEICSDCFWDLVWLWKYLYLRLSWDCVMVRERNWMYKLNRVFEELRNVILKESYDGEEKFFKIVILRLVIYYINVFENILE